MFTKHIWVKTLSYLFFPVPLQGGSLSRSNIAEQCKNREAVYLSKATQLINTRDRTFLFSMHYAPCYSALENTWFIVNGQYALVE